MAGGGIPAFSWVPGVWKGSRGPRACGMRMTTGEGSSFCLSGASLGLFFFYFGSLPQRARL